jgi:hypothetical protein
MINANAEPKGLGLSLYYNFLPRVYIVENINDFQENLHMILPTNKILPPGRSWNGLASIHFIEPLKYSKICHMRAELKDSSGSLEVRLDNEPGETISLTDTKRNSLRSGLILDSTRLNYSPKDGTKWLAAYDLINILRVSPISTEEKIASVPLRAVVAYA